MASEKRLIDANALQLEPDPWGGMNGVICLGRSGGKTMATVQAALKCMIDNAPTVDAVEVVHGRWEEDEVEAGDPYDGNSVYCFDVMRCSVCGECFDVSVAYNYCPNCGAKMDGERKDNERKAD